jgi:large subunit ribosomal protein L18
MDKNERVVRRRKSIRKKIQGSKDKPRMCLKKSLKNLFVQVVDDFDGKTICGIGTLSKSVKDKFKGGVNKGVECATVLGEEVAKMAIEKGVKKVVFDRSGYKYHGVIKAFADSARKHGLEF